MLLLSGLFFFSSYTLEPKVAAFSSFSVLSLPLLAGLWSLRQQ